MIIARFFIGDAPKTSGGVLIEGAIKSANYHTGGWFPIQSFRFGFEDPQEADKNQPATTSPARPPSSPAGANAQRKSGTSDKKDKNKLSIEKQVDRATTDLMYLAMSHRTQEGAKGEMPRIQCDIHVLSSVELKKGDEPVATIFPSFMVHLEGVKIESWGVTGSSDGRGSESLVFLFRKCAIRYIWTRDGKEMAPELDTGWDSDENKMWPDAGSDWHLKEFEPFTPRLC